MSPRLLNIYDLKTYLEAIENPDVIPLQVGTLEIDEKGQKIFKTL